MRGLHTIAVVDLIAFFESFECAFDIFKRRFDVPEFFDEFEYVKVNIFCGHCIDNDGSIVRDVFECFTDAGFIQKRHFF